MKQDDFERLKAVCEKEGWENIKGYEGLYVVSNLGQIKSLKTGKVRKPFILNSGYYAVSLSKKSKSKSFSIHSLVIENFTDPDTWLEQVNHKDLNKLNNSLENLEWCTRSQNNKHSYDFGKRKLIKGSDIGSAKLKEEDIPVIRELNRTKSMREIGRIYGVSHKSISSIIRKEHWGHV